MKLKATALMGAAVMALVAGSAAAADLTCLITKNNTNPFFVKMKEGAEAKAAEMGMDFQAYAGEKDGDAAPQITAIENCVAAGAKGILITPSNDSVGPALKAAREAGILVIALDTPLADSEAQDMTFATDNFEAGLLIGKWAAATMGDTSNARIAMLDINKDNISVDVARDTGFLVGFGTHVYGTTDDHLPDMTWAINAMVEFDSTLGLALAPTSAMFRFTIRRFCMSEVSRHKGSPATSAQLMEVRPACADPVAHKNR